MATTLTCDRCKKACSAKELNFDDRYESSKPHFYQGVMFISSFQVLNDFVKCYYPVEFKYGDLCEDCAKLLVKGLETFSKVFLTGNE
tara:strand:- start:697 stop:957 length:261 start_codon:yes stop_codon:yes gene_type:complete